MGHAMYDHLEDHGLPLVQLKELRRDLVVSLKGQTGTLSKQQIAEIASIQQAIAAIEAVMVDLEAEVETVLKERKKRSWRLIERECDVRRGGARLVAL